MEIDQVEGLKDEVNPRPKPILKLDKDVINKIAAAEIIHRPANAIKELLENSLDAGSTSIKITIKEGGLKLIQITDNGHGIDKADLPLLCTRYATSKLREYKDLESIGTYGFRGEALASISYCSHLEVITKTQTDSCGWKAHYADGELAAVIPGGSADPKPAAANDGTIISAEDLFFNMPLRKRAFKSASEEYNRILDVLTKYAVHNPHCAWVCKKAGSNLPDISTPANTTAKANISLLYTPSLAAELLEVKMTALEPKTLGAKCRGWVSNANTNWARKGGWLLFINNRLVDSSKIRKAIEAMYTAYLPKGAAPWIYLSLEIDPVKVDVNVHPTKSEVHFLNEDEIISGIVSIVHDALKGANTSRSFTVQTLLPGAPEPSSRTQPKNKVPYRDRPSTSTDTENGLAEIQDEEEVERQARLSRKKAAPNYKIRTDTSMRTLESMVERVNPSQLSQWKESQDVANTSNGEGSRKRRKGIDLENGDSLDNVVELIETDDEDNEDTAEDGREKMWNESGKGKEKGSWNVEESLCEFTSIQEMRRLVKKKGSSENNEIMSKHTFVGIVDRHLGLSLIQHSTRLFLVNHAILGDEHFYQLALRQFGALNRLKLEPPPDLRDLLSLAAEDEPLEENDLDIEEVVNDIYGLIMDKKEMIDEYFSMKVNDDGKVESLPMILKGYTPNLDRLPHFLLCLGTQINWEDEKDCFHTFLKELAFFYSSRPFSSPETMGDAGMEEHESETQEEINHQNWQLEHILFPSFRKYTVWPNMPRDTVLQVANLPDLFRVFERC